MAMIRRNLHSRLATLERHADLARGEDHPQVTVYLPRKDGDTQPCGVISDSGGVRFILYEAENRDRTFSNAEAASDAEVKAERLKT